MLLLHRGEMAWVAAPADGSRIDRVASRYLFDIPVHRFEGYPLLDGSEPLDICSYRYGEMTVVLHVQKNGFADLGQGSVPECVAVVCSGHHRQPRTLFSLIPLVAKSPSGAAAQQDLDSRAPADGGREVTLFGQAIAVFLQVELPCSSLPAH